MLLGNVEPVTPPAFAVVGRSKQSVNQSFVCTWRCIRDELIDLLQRGQQPDQVEADSSNERAPVGCRSGTKAVIFELSQYEPVERPLRLILSFHIGN